ncbi:hypothetical protein [uncultured Rhodoblastus sp.]|uniref:hypothetical protein n=1 Tax=uncultured Rhodoblastus sp. TaxID=543037 RepID=UPI0025F372A5|nr:hypothetical protein [uncultured Rhodoblastus sp.]
MFPEQLHRKFGDKLLDPMHEQDATAIHESGHAVAAWLFGIELESIRMTMHTSERTKAWSGANVAHARTKRLNLPADYGPFYRVHGIVTLAGPAAERKFRVFHDLPMYKGNEGDHDRFDSSMGTMLERSGRSSYAFRRLIWRRAQTMMEIEQVWHAVSELASYLTDLMDEEVWLTDQVPPTLTISLPWSAVSDAVHSSGLEKVLISDIFPRMANGAL